MKRQVVSSMDQWRRGLQRRGSATPRRSCCSRAERRRGRRGASGGGCCVSLGCLQTRQDARANSLLVLSADAKERARSRWDVATAAFKKIDLDGHVEWAKKSRVEFVHVRLGECLGWPQASPMESPSHLLDPLLDSVLELAEEAGGLETLPKLMSHVQLSRLQPPQARLRRRGA